MSHIDAQLEALRRSLAALEEQKRIEAEKELQDKKNPLKVLEDILDEKRKLFEVKNHNGVSYCIKCEAGRGVYKCEHGVQGTNGLNNLQPMPQHLKPEKDMINMLEPILNVLKDIQERLEVIEKKEVVEIKE